jgi:hypothetical protein
MAKHISVAAACLLGFCIPVATAQAGEGMTQAAWQSGSDACMAIASAKFAQWGVKRLSIVKTMTFADGSQKQMETVFTEDQAFGHEVGKPWKSMNFVRRQRGAPSPDSIAKHMGIVDCENAGPAPDAKEAASLIRFNYMPDANVSKATGEIWISDSTKLPLRQEMTQDAEAAHANVPVRISAVFAYDDAVEIPKGAEREADLRRFLTQQQWLSPQSMARAVTTTGGGSVGPGTVGRH